MSFPICGEDACECTDKEFVYCVGKSYWSVVVGTYMLPFLYKSMVRLVFQDVGTRFCFIAMCNENE